MPSIRLIAPEVYFSYACKCGDCRTTCCSAWGISVSDTEYFRLLGCDCSPELRRRLDAAFTPAEQPSPERFAFLSPSYTGNCRLLSESGLCSLQVECGEEIMPLICRVYPRAMRDMMTVNAAFAIWLMEDDLSLEDCVAKARKGVAEGAGKRVLP